MQTHHFDGREPSPVGSLPARQLFKQQGGGRGEQARHPPQKNRLFSSPKTEGRRTPGPSAFTAPDRTPSRPWKPPEPARPSCSPAASTPAAISTAGRNPPGTGQAGRQDRFYRDAHRPFSRTLPRPPRISLPPPPPPRMAPDCFVASLTILAAPGRKGSKGSWERN